MKYPNKLTFCVVLILCGLVYLTVIDVRHSGDVKEDIYRKLEQMQFFQEVAVGHSPSGGNATEKLKRSDDALITPVARCTPEERMQLLRHECKGQKSITDSQSRSNIRKIYNNIYVDEKHKVLTCIPPKAGCSTWKTILANNTFDDPLPEGFRTHSLHFGVLEKTFHVYNLAHYNQSMRDEFLTSDEYYRFILVRHPFERLYSGYINKLVSGIDMALLTKVGGMILDKYHPELSEDVRRSGKGVTFEEFIRFLKDTGNGNAHWDSIENLCQPCLVDYHEIVKTETMDDDNREIITNHMLPYRRGLGTADNVVAGGPQMASLTPNGRELENYQTLSDDEMDFLRTTYETDLRYFGYTWQRRRNETGSEALYSSCINGALDKICC